MSLKIENVSLSYDGRSILREVNAVISSAKGQVVGFLGPSGCGKTQLLRILAGLKAPDAGQVLVNDVPVSVGDMGVVAQNYPLFAHRTILGNLMIPANNMYPDNKQALSAVMHLLETYELDDKKDHHPAQLSGGQRQRIAILQMVLSKSNFILMDEPFASLDMIMLELTCKTILDMSTKGQKTIIVVTHDITSAVSISDQIWLLGHEKDTTGAPVPGAKLVETYDVRSRFQYEPGIITKPEFISFVAEVKNRFRSL